jgi:hypothetical protein
MTDDDDVQFAVTIKGVVKTTARNFCIETYLKEIDKHLQTIRYTCPKTDAIGEWTFTTHYSLNKTVINGKEVPNLKECCKDDEIKIEEEKESWKPNSRLIEKRNTMPWESKTVSQEEIDKEWRNIP